MTSNMLLLSFVFVLMIVVLWRLRGYAFAWGATADDVRRSWPGDELCPESESVATRADAEVRRVV